MRQSQPLATDLEQWLRARGFMLMDLLHPLHWRRGPVAPHPYVRRADPAYSRGQLVQWPSVAACAGSVDLTAALSATSRAYGRHACRTALKKRLRDLIPLVRSLLTGLPD